MTVDELFVGSGSVWNAETDAVFVRSLPELPATTVIERDVEAPAASAPMAHVTVPADSVQPGSADTNVALPGGGSTTATTVASAGPLLVTARSYVYVSPSVTRAGPVLTVRGRRRAPRS